MFLDKPTPFAFFLFLLLINKILLCSFSPRLNLSNMTQPGGPALSAAAPIGFTNKHLISWIVWIVLRKSAGRKGVGVEMVGKRRIKGLFTYFLIMDSMDSFEKVSW